MDCSQLSAMNRFYVTKLHKVLGAKFDVCKEMINVIRKAFDTSASRIEF